jgi:4-aminobutyrate aminotransferase-like enzyme
VFLPFGSFHERVVSAGSKTKLRAMSTSADSLVAFGQQHVTRGLGRLTEAVMTNGEGSFVTFEDGRRMLDFSCGIGVTNLGELLRAPQ